MRQHTGWAKALGIALFVIWAALAIKPLYREDWLLENLLVFVAVPLIARYGPGIGFSKASYTLFFLFFVLHLIGAHYTYAEVPWFERPDGRNHYDRWIHLLYGLLLARPTLELFAARIAAQGIWSWLMPFLFLASHGGLYETIEWLAAELFGGELGVAYLGTQGDEWDAQKDMGLALTGSLCGVLGWKLWLAWRGTSR